MATTTSHNKKSSAVKRILSEARELKQPSAEFVAYPLDDNIFEWHFTLRGPSGSEFEEGLYHGRILLPTEYPFRPPDVMILTPNGRWELNKKICLTFTGFHEEMWQPAWGIRTALIGVQAFMAARAEAAVGIGSLDYPTEERERLATRSGEWQCPVCARRNDEILPEGAGPRTQEALPNGLTIDPAGGKATQQEAEAGASQPASNGAAPHTTSAEDETVVIASEATTALPRIDTEHDEPQPSADVRPSSFGGGQGPADSMLEQMVRARWEESALHPSVSSSQVSTPGRLTPVHASQDEKETEVDRDAGSASEVRTDKGKERQVDADPSTHHERRQEAGRSSHQPSSLPPTYESSASQRTHTRQTSSSASPYARAPVEPVRHRASSAEASAQRLAALDRAIGTVIFLLAALVLRRLLNAWYA